MNNFANITSRRFHFNSAEFEIQPFEHLSESERAVLSELQKDPDNFGILKPRSPVNTPKSVTKDLALMLYALQNPGILPGFVIEDLQDSVGEEVLKLVLDQILLVENDGKFVCGAEAFDALNITHETVADGDDTADVPLSKKVSDEALDYAFDLPEFLPPNKLTARLYFYNRAPVDCELRDRFSDETSTFDFAFQSMSDQARKGFDAVWEMTSPKTGTDGWLVWKPKTRVSAPKKKLSYKLYVSPVLEDLPRAFEAAAETLAAFGCPRFKLGHGAHGLQRPDKFVAHFWDKDSVLEAAASLSERMDNLGIRGQGVPFTATTTDSDVVTWGVDPPKFPGKLAWQEMSSWRLWVASQLATSLADAKAEKLPKKVAIQNTLNRVALEGVDVNSWMPSEKIWATESVS